MTWLLLILAAYLLGSIPFGVIIGRSQGIDIREHGSRNIGATNVGRVLGKKLGLLCFALDVAKGAAPVLSAGLVTGVFGARPAESASLELWLWLLVAAAAVLGHMFSILLWFRGGKGVATGFGAMLAMWPLLTLPALGALAVWYLTLRVSRYVSIASIVAALSIPLWYLIVVIVHGGSIMHASPPLVGTLLIALLIMYRHRGNLVRISRGEEPKVGAA